MIGCETLFSEILNVVLVSFQVNKYPVETFINLCLEGYPLPRCAPMKIFWLSPNSKILDYKVS